MKPESSLLAESSSSGSGPGRLERESAFTSSEFLEDLRVVSRVRLDTGPEQTDSERCLSSMWSIMSLGSHCHFVSFSEFQKVFDSILTGMIEKVSGVAVEFIRTSSQTVPEHGRELN